MRLSIEITPEQHQRLEVSAALQGQTIKDYVLKRTLCDYEEEVALKELESLLSSRIEAVESGKLSSRSVDDIFNEVLDAEDKR